MKQIDSLRDGDVVASVSLPWVEKRAMQTDLEERNVIDGKEFVRRVCNVRLVQGMY